LHVSTGQTTKTNCWTLYSSPCTQFLLAGRELRFHTRITKNTEKAWLYPSNGWQIL